MTTQSKELPSFSDFSKLMSEIRYLKAVDERHREKLLLELYKVAEAKERMEHRRAYEIDLSKESREGRRRLSVASGLLRHALQDIRKARQVCRDELEDIESMHLDEWGFSFAEIEEHLKTTIEFVTSYEGLNAALVHPDLRTPREKRLANQPTPAIGEVTEEAGDHIPYPVKAKSRAIDHWLIGEAGVCLDKYRTSKNHKIQRYDTVIAKLFYVAFKEIHSEDSIRKELRRQEKGGSRITP
jgi:hypothetical protein